MEKVTYWLFRSKKVLKRLGLQHLLLIRLISNWTSCHTFQGLVVLVIFKCVFIRLWNYSISPWIVRHSVQLLLQIVSYLRILGHNSCPTRPNLGGGGVEPLLPCLDWRQGISGLTRHLNGRGKGSWRLPTTYIAYFAIRNWNTSCLVSSHTYIKSGEGGRGGLDCTDVHSFRRGTWNIAWIIGVNSAGIANRNETTYGPLICLLTLKQT